VYFGGCDMNALQKEKLYQLTDEQILAATLYGEARGASWKAKLGMGRVMVNRSQDKRFGKDIKDVVTKAKQFSCYNDNDPNLQEIMTVVEDFDASFDMSMALRDCYYAALKVLKGEDKTQVKDSLYYHTNAVNPSWNKKLKLEAQIGNTLFWKE
jgi:spore germination cell wall hydrolase CwlJ-like protein